MSRDRNKWVVRDRYGKVLGPFTTSQILDSIRSGNIGGDEQVALYPDGDWQSISKNPEFYDGLLDALAGEPEEPAAKKSDGEKKKEARKKVNRSVPESENTWHNDHQETLSIVDSKRRHLNTGERAVVDRTREQRQSSHQQGPHATRRTGSMDGKVLRGQGDVGDSVVLDLGKKEQILKKGKKRQLKKPLFFATFVFVLLVMVIFWPTDKRIERVHLRAPEKAQQSLDKKGQEEAYRRASREYIKDTFSGYWQSQNILVEAIEGAPRAKKLRSLLCLTYRELWPYSYQDSADLQKFELMAKKTSAMDPGGRDGSICDISLAIARSKYGQAGSLAKTALPNYKLEPVLYEVQAVILGDSERKYQVAIDYLRTIENLSPRWVKPYRLRGKYQLRAGMVAEAMQSYRKVLELNPKHSVALVYMGVIHHRHLKKSDRGLQYLSQAMNSRERMPSVVLVDAYKALAEISLQKKENSRARGYLEKAFALSPSDQQIRRMYEVAGGEELNVEVAAGPKLGVGDEYFRRGEYFLAQAEYRAVFQSDPTNAAAAFKAAQCFWELSQTRQAFEWLDRAMKVDPQYIDAYVKKAEYHTERYDYRSASGVLARARKLSPRNHLVYQGYARLYLRQENFPLAIKYAQQALRLYETDVEALSLLVRGYLGLKTTDGYGRAFEKAAQLQTLDQGNPKVQSIYIETLAVVQDLETALAKTEEFIELYPYTIEYRLLYGQLLLRDERYSEAVGYFNQVLQIDDKNKQALLSIGQALQALGRFNEARERLLQAATLDPSDVNSIYQLGQLYLRANQPMSAIRQFERVLENNPLYPRAHFLIGQAAMKAGNLGRALSEAESEAKINPNRPEPQLLLAEIYYLQRNYSQCISAYQKAIKLGIRKDSTTYIRQSRCMRLAGDPSTARQLLQQALLIESGNPEAWKEMGATCEMLGDMNCAVEGYRQYFNLAPNASDRRQIEDRIRLLQRGR